MTSKYIKIKDEKIPTKIISYKNSNTVKILFDGNILKITKPRFLSNIKLTEILEDSEDEIYNKYKKIISSQIKTIKQWQTGEEIYYKGTIYKIVRKKNLKNNIEIELDEKDKTFNIKVPENSEDNLKEKIDSLVKRLFKNNTEVLVSKKVPYWSNVMKLQYNEVKVRDAITRFGSCMPSKKNLYFSSRLIMLPYNVVDAIIVHEFCHMIYQKHDKKFYELACKYKKDYMEIDKWLKINSKNIMF